MAFVLLIVSCVFGVFIPETMFNDMVPIKAFYKAIKSLPANMLTSFMSTQLAKLVIQLSRFYILGGILMVRNTIVRSMRLRMRYNQRSNTKEHSEWV